MKLIFDYRMRPLKISTPLWTQTQQDAVNIYIANILNKKQEAAAINVLQLRILTNTSKVF